ncbi:hypothetical protein FHR32_001828 [Streptosporangium album]|uniref:Uncharacterized protein n=1 Tax=Streptosporangium album TaxID=47479 RepID=A0A7W7RTW5_9ACTN|nr:hypothetical protein [Streptosporangium album]
MEQRQTFIVEQPPIRPGETQPFGLHSIEVRNADTSNEENSFTKSSPDTRRMLITLGT